MPIRGGVQSARVRREAALRPEIQRVFDENFGVYGVRKILAAASARGLRGRSPAWARLMKGMGLQGIVRGKRVRTTVPDPAAACLDRVSRRRSRRRARRPTALGPRLHLRGDMDGLRLRRLRGGRLRPPVVGWRVSRTAHAGFVLDALEQAIHQRRPVKGAGLVAHSDRGIQYLAIR